MRGWWGRKGAPRTPQRGAGKLDSARYKRLSLSLFPGRVYAIGDVHGCLDLYQALEAHIVEEARKDGFSGPGLIVLLGDVIDRGPHAAQLIDHLLTSEPDGFSRITLLGNHEQMMLQFLDSPQDNLEWLQYGGRETLLSYGLSLGTASEVRRKGKQVRNLLQSYIPDLHRQFLGGLPVCLSVGPYLLSHAGYSAKKPLESHVIDDFLWSAPQDLDGQSGEWVSVHGHTIVEKVLKSPNRIAVDTGAMETGRLSAVRLGISGLIESYETHRVGPNITVRVDVGEHL